MVKYPVFNNAVLVEKNQGVSYTSYRRGYILQKSTQGRQHLAVFQLALSRASKLS
jgi:hypothetical protein